MKSGHSGDQCLVIDGMEGNDIVECDDYAEEGTYIYIQNNNIIIMYL